MRTICSREIFTKKCRQQQNFNSDPKEAWHHNHVTFPPIAKHFMLYYRLIYMLSMQYVRLMIKVKVEIPESFKLGWYPHKITGSSHLNGGFFCVTIWRGGGEGGLIHGGAYFRNFSVTSVRSKKFCMFEFE